MGKVVLLVALVMFGGWWHFHASRQMTEASINEHYNVESRALGKLDAPFLCEQMSDDYRDTGISFTLSGTRRHSRGKEESCKDMTKFFGEVKRFSALTGGRLGFGFDHRVLEVKLSDDRKTAKVEAIGVISLAGRTISRTQYVEHLIRRNGRILRVQADSKSWVYLPADG